MKKHLLTHSYKKAKYLCDECDFVGKSEVTMAVHIGKKHSKTFDCGLCDIETNSIQNLEIHLKHVKPMSATITQVVTKDIKL